VGLNVDHDVRIATSLDAGVVAGALLLVALLSIGVYWLRTRPALGFAVVWFFVALSVESSLIPIHDAMMEHRMYLAMPGQQWDTRVVRRDCDGESTRRSLPQSGNRKATCNGKQEVHESGVGAHGDGRDPGHGLPRRGPGP